MESYEHGYEDNRFENDVSKNFHCPICFNVFKDPVSCQRNQHMFCRPCITRHLKNSQTCPTCMEALTIETLNQAPRILTDYLSELRIRCNYFTRGCRDLIQLDELETHVKDCDFTPVVCSNEGCSVEVNKRDRIHHETEVCEMRKIKCHNCTEMTKAIEDIRANLKAANTKLDEIEEIKVNLTTVQRTQEEILKEIRGTTPQGATNVKPDGSVVVVGGKNLSSVEIFNWSTKSWSPLQPMDICRSGTSSFVYKNQITITGGQNNNGFTVNTMKTLNIDQLASQSLQCQWADFPVNLPGKLCGHSSVLYNEGLIVMGGFDNNNSHVTYSDSIYEVMLDPHCTSKLLKSLPQPRCFHGTQLFDDNIVIVGGRRTGFSKDNLDSVLMYDIKSNECKEMTPLPFAVHEMATVRWGDNIIVIGGVDNNDRALDTVVIYNVQTGKSYLLPAMKYKRRGCAAAVTGNVLVVMGGKDEKRNVLKSVECFSFDRYSWEDLPPMNEARARATSVAL